MKEIALIGSGAMGIEYARVLQALQIPFIAIGRSEKSVKKFKENVPAKITAGGLENFLKKGKLPAVCIVAVDMPQLKSVTLMLLKNGAKSILVEKPAGMNLKEIQSIVIEAKKRKAKVFVAYNRRFYASVLAAEEMIRKEGGVSSFNFEFTEWSHQIKDLQKPKEVKQQWFLGNSTHVIDLAFYLGGIPKKMTCFQSGALPWHPKASVFSGAGTTKSALFSYQANWEAPGRWGVEMLTKKSRFIFRPLEQLHVQRIGSVAIEKMEINDSLDKEFKPGLYKQTEAFLKMDTGRLLSIEAHAAMMKNVYSKILK